MTKKETKKKESPMTERLFLKFIKEAFEHDDNLRLHRRNVAAGNARSGRFMKFGEAGQSDLFGTIKEWTCPYCGRKREGVSVEIEVKGIKWRSDGVWSKDDDSICGGDGQFYIERLDTNGKPTESYYRVGHCPFGVPGNRLWVRETFADIPETTPGNLHYRASASNADLHWFDEMGWKWQNAMFMPREYSRLTLEIVNVRCERIKSISAGDCLAEGYESIDKYIDEWDRLNANRGFSWESNPWVWVIEFKRIEEQTEPSALALVS